MPHDAIQPSLLRRTAQRVAHAPGLAPLLALVLLLSFNALFTPNFTRLEVQDGRLFGSLVDILQNGAPVLLLALGMTLVVATGGIDLSVGSVMALAGVVAALAITQHDLPVVGAVGVALGVALLAGVWNGLLVTTVGLQPIVATLVLLVAGRGIAQALSGDQKVRFAHPALEFIGNGAVGGMPFPIILAAGVLLIVLLAVRYTVLGLYVEAVGGNLRAARLCGLRVNAVRIVVYAFCGLCAGLAGLVMTADIKEADVANCGLYLELDAILAVVIGGTPLTGGRPRLWGSVIGALVMQTLTITLQMRGVVTEHTLIIKALVALAVCAAQAPGLATFLRRGRRVEA